MPQAIPVLISLALHSVHGIAWVNALAQAMTVATVMSGLDSIVKNNSKPREQGGLIALEVNPSPPRRLIVGKRAVAGTLVDWYLGSTNNTKLYLPVYLSEGPCGTITKVWAGGRPVWTTPLVHGVRTAIPDFRSGGDRVWLTYYDGRIGQTADPTLVALGQGWTAANKMTGCSWVLVELQWDSDNLRTPPAFIFEHEGAKLYDRRKDTTAGGSGLHRLNDPSTWELGDAEGANPMVSLDHFQLGRFWNGQRVFGIGMPSKFVPYDKFAAQANICDENVTKKAGGTQKRYRANGVIYASEAWDEIVKRHCVAMVAQAADFGGRVGVIGAEARTPVMEIHDDDLPDMASEVYVPKRSFGTLVGVVRGRFQDPAQVYQPVPYAEVSDPAWNTQDGAEPREFTFDLDFETDRERAERLATLKARQERRQAQLTGVYPYHTIELERGDWFVRVGAAGSRFGTTGKTFEVLERVFDPKSFTVTIVAQEVDPDDSAWDESLAADPPPAPIASTAALSAISPPAITVTAISLTGTLSSVPALRIQWTAPTDPRVRFLYVEVENTDGVTPKTAKTVAIPSDANFVVVSEGVADGEEYGVSAKFLSDSLQSDWCIAAIVASTGSFATGAASSVPWSGVTGAGKPADNATVGGTFGVDVRETNGGTIALLNLFKTSLGQAATILSQGAFATLSSVSRTSGFLTDFGALAGLAFASLGTNIRRADGTTVVTDALAITSLGQAATIAGQGAFATLSSVARTSGLLTDFGALAGLAFASLGTNIRRADGTTVVTDALAITSLGQAATIAGQGAFATLSSVARTSGLLTDFGSLAGLAFTTLGTNVRRADGTTAVTDALAITSLGQAATIAGQGAFATVSTASRTGGLLTDFAALAGLSFTTLGTNVRRADGTTQVTDALAITSLGQAATIAGQGSLATQNLVSSALLAAGVGANAMYDTQFALDYTNNFRGLAQSGTPTRSIATSVGVAYQQIEATGVTIGHIISIDDYPQRNLFPVKAGDIVEAHGLVGGQNCSAYYVRITWRDAALAALSFPVGSSVASPGAGGGATSTYTKVGIIATAPANAAFAQVEFIGTASTSAPRLRVARPFKSLAKAGQTEFSEWGPGIEAEIGADVTVANQAASFTGQASLATLNFTTFGSNVRRADGTTVVTDALAITSLGQAATITGQGSFATLSSVARTSGLLTDFGSLAGLAFTTLGTNVRRADGTTAVTDATAITSLGQAATIAGQGTGATASTLAALNATDNANLNSALAGIRRIGDVNDFSNDGLHWTTTFGGTPDAASDPTADGYFNVADIGRVIRLSATAYLTKKSVFKPVEGRRYLQVVRLRAHTNPSSGVMTAALSNINGLDVNYVHGAGVASATITPPNAIFQKASFVVADGWITLARVWVAGPPSTYNAYWRFRLDITQTGAGGKVEVVSFDDFDVTDIPVGRSLSDLFRADGTTALTDATVVTSLGQAATITGQGALATLNQTNLGASGRVYRDDGVTRLTDATAVTSLGQAATIAGQGSFATLSSASRTGGLLTGFGGLSGLEFTTLGTNVRRADGTTQVTDALAITSLGQAATITGQGALATLNQTNLGASGRVYRDDGVTRLTDATAVTSLGQAATIAGQGALATKATIDNSSLMGSGVVTFTALSTTAVRLGTNITRADGSTSVTDATAITSLGQAATISGQGSFATLSSVARTSGLLTDFGSLAGLSNALGLTAGSITGQQWGATATEDAARATRGTGLAKNSNFEAPFTGAAVPPLWSDWSFGSTATYITKPIGDGKCVQHVGVAAQETGFVQNVPVSASQDFLLRATVRRQSGTFVGSGVHCQFFNASNTPIGAFNIGFATDPNTAGITSSTHDGVQHFEKVATAPAGATYCLLYAMVHWSGHGSIADANSIAWYECDIVPMSLVRQLRADVTGGNQAASFIGQAALATLSFVQLSSNVRLADGTTIATNATLVTAQGQSASFVGQGALATKNVAGAGDISVANLGAISATIGLLRTATTGARMELESNQGRVYDSAGVLRVRWGVW